MRSLYSASLLSMEETTTTLSSKTFLGLPLELRNKIYKEVFADSHMRLELVETGCHEAPEHDFYYIGPENYATLLTCSQVKLEATPVLLASLCIYIEYGCSCHLGFPIDFAELNQSSSGSAGLLRHAIPHIRRIKFEDVYSGGCISDLKAFPQLRQLQIIEELDDLTCSDVFPDHELVRNPLLLLGHAHDRLLIETTLRLAVNFNHNLASCLEAATSKTRPYQVIWESHLVLSRPPSVYEPGESLEWPHEMYREFREAISSVVSRSPTNAIELI